MEDWVYGLLAIVAGTLFCFRGYLAFRIIIPAWGAFVGLTLGAGLVASFTDEGFLRTGLAWIVGVCVAVLFALLAYLFYEVSVVIAMGSIGFALGASLMVALDVSWTWAIVLVGLALGALLAVAAIVSDLPMVLLVVLSAFGGASAITTGIMILAGAIDTAEFTDGAVTEQADNDWWWYVIYLALAVTGVVVQSRAADRLRRSLRETWTAERGRA